MKYSPFARIIAVMMILRRGFGFFCGKMYVKKLCEDITKRQGFVL